MDTVPKIRVVVRKRPLNAKETKRQELEIVKVRSGTTLGVEELK